MTDKARTLDSYPRPIGLAGLIEDLNLEIPLPAVRSAVVRAARKTIVRDDGVIMELYPYSYKPEGLIGNLKFAMRYEPIDLGVLKALFKVLDPTLFPVSAVMLRDSKGYNSVLTSFSSSIQPMIEYSLDSDGRLTVHNETADLYRYWDATQFAEYLNKSVAETIRIDLKDELDFLVAFDAAMKAVMEIVDMPNRRTSLLIRLILQNKGTLSKGKHSQFSELSDDEIRVIESAIQSCMAN